VTWQQYSDALPVLPESPTREQWIEAVQQAEALLEQVQESDRHLASRILGDTLVQAGAFLGFIKA
jgi:homoserine kinase